MSNVIEKTKKESEIQNKEIEDIVRNYNIKNLSQFEKLKDFYKERNDTVLKSRIDSSEEANIYKEKRLNKIPNIEERDIDDDIMEYLFINNFKPNEKGTEYLKELIETLYHERYLYDKTTNDEFNYWDLDNYTNIHYKYVGSPRELVISEIIKTIVNSRPSTVRIDISRIVYNGVNSICEYNEKNKETKKYQKKNESI